jgi:hypothetical protein
MSIDQHSCRQGANRSHQRSVRPQGVRNDNTNANEIRSRDESSTTTDESNYNTKNHTIENRKSKREVANGVRSSADAHHHDSLRAFRSVDV